MKYISKIYILFSFLFLTLNLSAQSISDGMNNKKMEAIMKAEVQEFEGELGSWQMLYGERLLLVLTDEPNNRMRIFSPVVEEKDLEEGQLKKMLEANFHTALDSKYSLYNGFVITVFTHPLKELTKDQLIDAMRQVVVLAETFGTTYTSTALIFGGGNKEEEGEGTEKEEKNLNKKPTKKM